MRNAPKPVATCGCLGLSSSNGRESACDLRGKRRRAPPRKRWKLPTGNATATGLLTCLVAENRFVRPAENSQTANRCLLRGG